MVGLKHYGKHFADFTDSEWSHINEVIALVWLEGEEAEEQSPRS